MSQLFVVSAPSGAGKTTLCRKLLGDFSQLVLSISFTTRKPRGSEQEGQDYHYLSREEFQRRIREGHFAEWAEVHGNFYGTSKAIIDQTFAAGKSVLLDIDVQGADSLARAYPKQCVRIFIAPPSLEELEFRLRARATDSEETIQKRLRNARLEIQQSSAFDLVIVNDALDRAYGELQHYVQSRL